VIIHGSYYDEANDYAMKLAAERDYLYIHSINEPLLYPGVATMHLEVVEELPDVDVVINPIGGGSGVSGAVVVYKAVNPAIRVIGVQASGAPAFYTSWKSGGDNHHTRCEHRSGGAGHGACLRISTKHR